MALDAVLGDAEHGGSRGGEFLAQRSEIERFFRASGGIVLGIEIDDQLPAVEIAKADRLAAFALHGEIRRLRSRLNHAAIPFAISDQCSVTHCRASSRSEEHTSELQSLMRISYAVFC